MTPFSSFLISNVVIVAALALLVFWITRVWKNPHVAHALWLLVMIKMVTPPIVKMPLPDFSNSSEIVVANAVSPTLAVAPPSVGIDSVSEPAVAEFAEVDLLQPALIGVWVAGVLALGITALRRLRKLSMMLRDARPAPRGFEAEVLAISAHFGLAEAPRLLVSDAQVSPFVTASFRRRQTVLLPSHLTDVLDADQLRTVLAHEIAHVRRGDRWVRLFELLVLGVFWWNPVMWFASRKQRQAAEECCDAMVIWALPDSRRSYGTALFRTVEFISESGAAAPIGGVAFGEPPFKQRIRNIMKKETNHQMPTRARLAVILLGLIALPLATTANSNNDEKSKLEKPSALFPIKEKPVRWKRMSFILGEEPEGEREFVEKLSKKKMSSMEEVNQFLRQEQIVILSQNIAILDRSPTGELADVVNDLKVNEVSVPVKVGKGFYLFVKEFDAKQMKANRAHAAQFRLLQLDVKAAKIRAVAAREKVGMLEALAEKNRVAKHEVRSAQVDSDLADITVERAAIAVELFIAKRENSNE